MNKEVKIYALINPLNNYVFYIGATTSNLNKRLNEHISERNSRNNKKNVLIKELILNNMEPEILELDVVSVLDASFFEIFYQQLYTSYGFNLLQRIRSGYNEYQETKKQSPVKENEHVFLILPGKLVNDIKELASREKNTFQNQIIHILTQASK